MTGRAEEWFHDYRRSTKCSNETFQQFTHVFIHHFAGADDERTSQESYKFKAGKWSQGI